MASRPSKFTIDCSSSSSSSSSMTTSAKYAETCLLTQKTHRRRNCKSPIGVPSFGEDRNDSGLVNHDPSSMVPLPTEASIKWDVNSNEKSGCSEGNFRSSSQVVEASLSWLINANGDETEEELGDCKADSVDDEVSTSAFAKYASSYFPRSSRRNSKPPKGVLNIIGTHFEDDNSTALPLPSEASINWLQ